MTITGYPDFARLEDQEVARQLKVVWDALIGVSQDVDAIAVPDLTALTQSLLNERRLREQLERDFIAAQKRPLCAVYRSAAQTLTTGTETDVLWTNEWFDPTRLHDPSTNPDRVTIRKAGYYLAGAHFIFESNAVGSRAFYITLNDPAPSAADARLLSVAEDTSGANPFGICSGAVLIPQRLVVGDILRVSAVQTSGGDLDIEGTTTYGPRTNGFWVLKVSD